MNGTVKERNELVICRSLVNGWTERTGKSLVWTVNGTNGIFTWTERNWCCWNLQDWQTFFSWEPTWSRLSLFLSKSFHYFTPLIFYWPMNDSEPEKMIGHGGRQTYHRLDQRKGECKTFLSWPRKFLFSFSSETGSYYSIFSFLKVYEMYIFIKFCLDVLKEEGFRIKKKENSLSRKRK